MKYFWGWRGAMLIFAVFLANEAVPTLLPHTNMVSFLYVTIRWPLVVGTCFVHIIGTLAFVVKSKSKQNYAAWGSIVVTTTILTFQLTYPLPLVSLVE